MTEEPQGVPSDPDAGNGADQAATPAAGKAAGGPGPAEERVEGLEQETERLRGQLVERTADLQRLQAEYQNYRKRVDRDRQQVKETAVAAVLSGLLPVLDDIGRARDHGELVGGFKAVGESTEAIAAKLGLEQYGKEGEPFDPQVHEALMHSYSDDVAETTCVQVLQPGYRLGERILRPARVAVAEPQPGGGGLSKKDKAAEAKDKKRKAGSADSGSGADAAEKDNGGAPNEG